MKNGSLQNRSLQWRVADRRGEKCEGAYETPVEAKVQIERMYRNAVKTMNDAKCRVQEGRAHFTDETALAAVERFTDAEYRVVEEPLNGGIYRLNADISCDMAFLHEVLWKLRVLGEVQICWTCTGHTRADMQGAATAAFLQQNGYECEVNSCGDVTVRTAKGVAR